MKVKLNLSNFNNDFQSDSEVSNLNSVSDSLIPIGRSGIHIKKENRGKFTDYCGGKVTDACIRKAKASGNPKLVKRATFAQNARKWKHQQGGTIADQKTQLSETPWIRHKTFEEYDSLGRPLYNRYDSFYGDGIEQMQGGGPVISDVDTRSDTTRKGYHEGQASYGANQSFPLFEMLGIVNDKLSAQPQPTTAILPNGETISFGMQTGEPIILPGKVGKVAIVEREAPAAIKVISGKTTKVEQSAAKLKPNERYVDKRDYTKRQRNQDKLNQTYETGDNRHAYSGPSGISNSQLKEAEKTIRKYYPDWAKRLDRIDIRLQNATNPDVITRIKAERKDFLRSFLNRGIKQ